MHSPMLGRGRGLLPRYFTQGPGVIYRVLDIRQQGRTSSNHAVHAAALRAPSLLLIFLTLRRSRERQRRSGWRNLGSLRRAPMGWYLRA